MFTFSEHLSYVAKSRSLVMSLAGSLLLNLASILFYSGHIISFSFDLPRIHVCYPEHGIMIQRVVFILYQKMISQSESTILRGGIQYTCIYLFTTLVTYLCWHVFRINNASIDYLLLHHYKWVLCFYFYLSFLNYFIEVKIVF